MSAYSSSIGERCPTPKIVFGELRSSFSYEGLIAVLRLSEVCLRIVEQPRWLGPVVGLRV